MQYNAPYGVTDPNAPYINGDPTQGRQGSIPPASAFEYPQREIINLIAGNGLVPTNDDLWQMLKGTRSQASNYGIDTGSVNNLSVAYNPPISVYTPGLPLRVRVHSTNTGPAAIDAGAGRVGIKRPDGSSVAPGDLPGGGVVDLVYDGTNFQMVNYLGGASTGAITNNFNNVPYAVDTSSTPNQITVAFTPALPPLAAGSLFLVKIANTNTADTIINVDTHLNLPIRANGGGRLLPGDLTVGDVKLFAYDGSQFQITPNPLIPASITINIPSTQYPDFATAMAMLSRKTVSVNATVTMKLGVGIFPPIHFTHKDGGNFIIAGTMLAAAPSLANFSQTGSSAAARASDATANLTMLRARYGTEIQTVGSGAGPGFRSYGAGAPQVQDLLITGDKGLGTAGIMVDVAYPLATSTQANNVAVWGCNWGYYSGGKVRATNGSCTNCGVGGACNSQGLFAAVTHFSLSNDFAGYDCTLGGCVVLQLGCQANYNGSVGMRVGNNSMGSVQGSVLSNNASWDIYAAYNSSVSLVGSSSATNNFTPPLGTIGNFNAIITAS
jgi:hypothetical protein